MELAESFRKAWVVTGLTVRYLLGTRRIFPMAALSAVPLLIVLGLAAAHVRSFDILLFQVLMIPLFLQIVLIFVTLVSATSLIREEIEDNTLPYLLTRPISKPAIAAYKYAGYLIAVLVLLLPPVVLAYATTELYRGTALTTDLDVLGGFLAATVLGVVAYGALFLFVSILLRRPLALGLLIGFVWESIVGSLPGQVPKLSVIYYLKSVLKDTIAVGPLSTNETLISAGVATAILVAFAIVMLALTMFVFQQTEFRQKA